MGAFGHIGAVASPATYHPFHSHEVWELVLYTSGTGAITVGEHAVEFSPGTIVCLPPHIPHMERSAGGYTNHFLIFQRFTPPRPGIPVFRDDARQSFRQLSTQLLAEFTLRQPGWRPLCESLADLLVRYLQRWAMTEEPTPTVAALKQALAEGMAQAGFSAGDALAAVGCSNDHARRQFRAATGMTPTAYLTQLRLQEAKRLLLAGMQVQEAAAQVGLPDPFYFSRVFRRQEGISPRDFQLTSRQGGL